ncbi:hypothetical protein a51_104 [Escherichia phage a51]|nr:hypothetical protein a51_104 [Escherichia phage a51]
MVLYSYVLHWRKYPILDGMVNNCIWILYSLR